MLASTATWDVHSADPSVELAPEIEPRFSRDSAEIEQALHGSLSPRHVRDTSATRPRHVPQAPYTAERLRAVTAPGFSPRPKLLAPLRVLRVERAAGGGFDVVASWKAAESMPPPGPLRKPLGADATDRGDLITRD